MERRFRTPLTSDFPDVVKVAIPGKVKGDLAVHPSLKDLGCYTVTHIPTGFAFMTRLLFEDAWQLFIRLNEAPYTAELAKLHIGRVKVSEVPAIGALVREFKAREVKEATAA